MANFLFVLSKNDTESASRCFQLAKIAHSKDHKVNLFLIDEGVRWADKTRSFTDNVIELIVERLRKLPEPTRRTLELAACVGSTFEASLLSAIREQPVEQIHHDLWHALHDAIVLRSERCSLNSRVKSTMRGSVLHQRIGWPSLNQGKMPRA